MATAPTPEDPVIWAAVLVVGAVTAWWFVFSQPSAGRLRQITLAMRDGDQDALLEIPKRHRAAAAWQVATQLLLDEEIDAGLRALELLSEVDPVAAAAKVDVLVEHLETHPELAPRAVAVCARALQHRPNSISARSGLVRLLLGLGDLERAMEVLDERSEEPDLVPLRIPVLHALGRSDEAQHLARQLEQFADHELQRLTDTESLLRAVDLRDQATSLRHELQRQEDHDFEPIVELASSGRLRADDPDNHELVGRTLRDDAPLVSVPLEHPVAMGRRAFDRLANTPDDLEALCDAGESELRSGDPDRAADLFRTAVRQEPESFRTHLGRARALRAATERWMTDLGALPDVNIPCPSVFPDLAALTEDEQRVVTASVGALAPWLEGQTVRIRPLAHVAAPDEHWVSASLLFSPEWPLAWVVAVQAFHALPDDRLARLTELLERVEARPELAAWADLEHLPAFFAALWVEGVRERWRPDPSRDADQRALLHDLQGLLSVS